MLLLEIGYTCPYCGWQLNESKTGDCLLHIGKQEGDSKLAKKLNAYSFDLLAGHDCPGAAMCFGAVVEVPGEKSRMGFQKVSISDTPVGVDPEKWKAKHGITPENKYRCFGASLQVKPGVYTAHKNNSDLIRSMKTKDDIARLIINSIDAKVPRGSKYFRIHAIGGDFFTEKYLQAWMQVAEHFPDMKFYTYTKMIPLVLKHENDMPGNLKIVLSMGSVWDKMTLQYGEKPEESRQFKVAWVVFNRKEAKDRGLKIDKTDEMAALGNSDFAIKLHGGQAKDTRASKEWQKEKESRKAKKAKLKSYNALMNV